MTWFLPITIVRRGYQLRALAYEPYIHDPEYCKEGGKFNKATLDDIKECRAWGMLGELSEPMLKLNIAFSAQEFGELNGRFEREDAFDRWGRYLDLWNNEWHVSIQVLRDLKKIKCSQAPRYSTGNGGYRYLTTNVRLVHWPEEGNIVVYKMPEVYINTFAEWFYLSAKNKNLERWPPPKTIPVEELEVITTKND